MSLAFDADYVYARACGSLARSFLGDRAAALARCSRAAEAWRVVFGDQPPALPETALAAEAESRLAGRAESAIRKIAGPLAMETPLLGALSLKREMAYLKRALAAAAEGEREPPHPGESGLYPGFSLDAFPDIERMVRNTAYQWIAEAGTLDLSAAKNRLDRQYYQGLWAAANAIPAARRGSIPALVRIEAELENAVWALRLSRYYGMGSADIAELLIGLSEVDAKAPAIAALAFRVDSRSDWRGWKWERVVPDVRKEGAGGWRLDLRGLEAAADAYLFGRLVRALHMEGGTYAPIYAFFKIKELEAAAIRGIFEGIEIEAPEEEIAAFAAERTGGAA
jgi:hypothetical protein